MSRRSRNSGEINGVDHGDLDKLKSEILSELRKEIQKAKAEIIEGELTVVSIAFLIATISLCLLPLPSHSFRAQSSMKFGAHFSLYISSAILNCNYLNLEQRKEMHVH